VFQLGEGTALVGHGTDSSRFWLSSNFYINTSGSDRYIDANEASAYQQHNGKHIFSVAPSGTADAAISFTTALTIDNSGNVGIGTPSPDNKLHLYGPVSYNTTLQIETTTAGYDPTIIFESPANSRGIYVDDNDSNKLKFWTGYGKGAAGKEVTFDNNGAVGIGTTSPGAPLHVKRTGDGSVARMELGGVCQWDWKIGNSTEHVAGGHSSGELNLVPLNANMGFAIGTSSRLDARFYYGNLQIGDSLTLGATGKLLSSGDTDSYLQFNQPNTLRAVIGSSTRMIIQGGETVFNEDGENFDLRVESDEQPYMLTVDAGANSVRVATADTGIPASLEIQNIDTKFAISQRSASYISGTNQSAKYAEGVEAYNTTSSGTILTIPITDQPNLWHQYIVEFMFCSAEYNSHSSAKAGTLKIGFTSLNGGPVAIAELEKTGNVDSVSGNDSNLLITFTSGYTSGLNNYEGVICHYRVLGYSPEYLQMWNGTLN